MDQGHDGTQGKNYSPLGIIVRFPVRVTSLCASLGCALPTRPQGRDAQACVHVRQVERTTLEGAGEKTPRLIFVGHQLAATEQQQGEKSPPHPLPAPPPSFGGITSTSKMSQGDFGDDNDVDDAFFLADLMSTTDDIDVERGNEEDGAVAATSTLPVLGNIWECPMLRKLVTTDDSGKDFTGWSCGWCMKRDDVPFRGVNASKALWHVLKEAGHDIRPCRGHIPHNKLDQYRQLAISKAQAKDLRVRKNSTLTTTIGDLQDRAAMSMSVAGRAFELVHCSYCFVLLSSVTYCLHSSCLQ
jgi:hypothetical protein